MTTTATSLALPTVAPASDAVPTGAHATTGSAEHGHAFATALASARHGAEQRATASAAPAAAAERRPAHAADGSAVGTTGTTATGTERPGTEKPEHPPPLTPTRRRTLAVMC